MRNKVLIVIIVILVLALFVETAYLFQLKFEITDLKKITSEFYNNSIQGFQRDRFGFNARDPFEELNRIQSEFNKIFQDGFLFNFNLEDNFDDKNNIQKRWHFHFPQKDLYETEREYIVKLNLPGLGKNNLNIEIKS